MKNLLLAGLLAMGCLPMAAAEPMIEAVVYSQPDGRGGLKLATLNTRDNSYSEFGDYTITGSDFGPWGSHKRMYNPQLLRDTVSGTWRLLFNPDKERTVIATSTSPDLISWTVQEYYDAADAGKIPTTNLTSAEFKEVTVGGTPRMAATLQLPVSTFDKLNDYRHYRKEVASRDDQRTDQDAFRFAKVKGATLDLSLLPDNAYPISTNLIGIFFEDINYGADGGLYGELIENRDFEYKPSDRGNDQSWNALSSWSPTSPAYVTMTPADTDGIHPNNATYLKLKTTRLGQGIINDGYDGIPFKEGEKYNFTLWIRAPRGAALKATLLTADNRDAGSVSLQAKDQSGWQKLSGVITARHTAADGKLRLVLARAGEVDLDMISLFPQNTFKNRPNGLRRDLAETLAALKPRFVRFPGGCVSHGDGIDNIYDWKGSIGDLEARKPLRNLWGYHQSRGLGFYEYFQFCEDIGAEPLPVLAAGVPCQNSGTPAHHSHNAVTSLGQQCGIPMDEMDAYIADILDLIEYANGPVTSEWGARRAAAGHPEPFNLKYLGIGNEDLISKPFEERFEMIYKAVKEKYPEIQVVGTAGPFYEGADYEEGWRFARELGVPIVDEHYYVSPGWLINHGDYYDNYPRDGGKVYLGEYASHLPGRPSNIEAALSDALYLTNIERNADVVEMTSYAPLLARNGHTQWRPDMIYFDNETITLTPDYHVQRLYGNNSGDRYIPAERTLTLYGDNGTVLTESILNGDMNARLGASAVRDPETGKVILKLVNLTPVAVETKLPVTGSSDDMEIEVLSGYPDDTEATLTRSSLPAGTGTYSQPPYSMTVIRF